MVYERRANYYETDQMAIIHHSNYIRWFEEARIRWMDEMGFSYKRLEEAGIQIPVLEVNCSYHSMVRFDDTVLIQVQVEEYTGTRLKISYVIHDKASGEVRTTGFSRHCFINREGRVISLKKALPQAHITFGGLK